MRAIICRYLSVLLLAGWISKGYAIPVLSPDGATLTGVVLSGTTYEVTFVEGILEDLFPVSMVQAPGWFDLANDMTAAIAAALASLEPLPQHTDINGCEHGPGIPGFVGPGVCIIGIPDTVSGPLPSWRFDSFVVVNTPQSLVVDAPNNIVPGGVSLAGGFDSGADPDLAHFTTFAQFRVVPVPATLTLVLLGGIVLRITRGRY